MLGEEKLKAPDIAIVLISAAFWSWTLLAVFRPTYFLAFQFQDTGELELFSLYRFVALLSCAVMLLAYTILQSKISKILNLKKWEWFFLGTATLGGILALTSSILPSNSFVIDSILIFAAGILVGVSIPYFLLEWCRMYLCRGARICALYISGSLSISFVISLLVLSFDSTIGAFFTILIPILIAIALKGLRSLSAYFPSSKKTADFDAEEAYGASPIFRNDPSGQTKYPETADSISEIPKLMYVFSILGGVAFGLTQNLLSQSIGEHPSIQLVFALGTGILFVCAYSNANSILIIIEIFVGLATVTCILPSMGFAEFLSLPIIQSALLTLGFVALVSWAFCLFTFFIAGDSDKLITVTSMNLFFFVLGAAICTAATTLISNWIPSLTEPNTLISIAGIIFIVLIVLGLTCSSSPLPIFVDKATKAIKSPQESTAEIPHTKQLTANAAVEFGLTDREEEVLGLMIIGRSRPRIAEQLCVSENTVNSHVSRIYRKAGVNGFQELLDLIYL